MPTSKERQDPVCKDARKNSAKKKLMTGAAVIILLFAITFFTSGYAEDGESLSEILIKATNPIPGTEDTVSAGFFGDLVDKIMSAIFGKETKAMSGGEIDSGDGGMGQWDQLVKEMTEEQAQPKEVIVAGNATEVPVNPDYGFDPADYNKYFDGSKLNTTRVMDVNSALLGQEGYKQQFGPDCQVAYSLGGDGDDIWAAYLFNPDAFKHGESIVALNERSFESLGTFKSCATSKSISKYATGTDIKVLKSTYGYYNWFALAVMDSNGNIIPGSGSITAKDFDDVPEEIRGLVLG